MAGARQRLPDPRAGRAPVRADPRTRAPALRPGHFGVFADGVLLLSAPAEPSACRRPADLQPRRLGGRAVGQRRARGDPVSAPARLDRRGRVRDRHPRRARSARRSPARTRARSTWAGRASPPRTSPAAPPDGRGEVSCRRTAPGTFATSRSATPSARSASPPRRSWRRSTWPRSVPPIEADAQFPNRTNVSWYAELEDGRAGAHPRADLRARRGGDAVIGHRRHAARRWPTPRKPLDGGRPRACRPSCSTAVSSRSKWGRICSVNLTGWARPVFEGRAQRGLREGAA